MALRVGCKIVCSHFENEFCAMTIPKNYHRSALRCAYNCKRVSHMEDVETNPYIKKFAETEKIKRRGHEASQFATHSRIPTNNFTVNRSFNQVFGLDSTEHDMAASLRIRKMSTLQKLAEPESDDEGDPPVEEENEFARSLYNRFRMPPLRDQRTLNQIAFSRKHVTESPKLPNCFQNNIASGKVSSFKKPPTVKTSPRGLRHQFNFSSEKLPERSFFSSTDLLDPLELKRVALQKINETPSRTPMQTDYSVAPGACSRTWRTSSIRTSAFKAQPNIFSKMAYSNGDIWKRRKYAPRFVADSESLKLNLVDQTNQTQPNLYHDMANVPKSPREVTSRLSLLLSQNILQSNTRRLTSTPYVNGYLANANPKTYGTRNPIPTNVLRDLKESPPKDVSTSGQMRIAGFVPLWPGKKGKSHIKTWCFKPKKQRKDLSFLKQFLMSCYKRSP